MTRLNRLHLQNQLSVTGHKVRSILPDLKKLDADACAVNSMLYCYKDSLTMNDRIALRQYYRDL